MKNKIYINVAVMGSVNQVLSNLLSRIKESDLYESVDQINLIINGDLSLITTDLTDSKYKVFNKHKDVYRHEFPALDLIWNHSDKEDFNILYLHTKGVSRTHTFIEDWTNYMSYFNINKWKDRIKDLEKNDCTGVNLSGNSEDINEHPSTWGYGKAPKHYSGNFWWSRSSHIRKLPNPYSWIPTEDYNRWRMMNEMWVCQIPNSKYHFAWNSNINHYQQAYPSELYSDKPIKKVNFVVSKYNEDISWINNIKKSRVFIYDKSNEDNDYIKLENVGREAHTYLTHIIRNYDNLSDYVCFLQGNPYSNEKGHLNKSIDELENMNSDFDIMPLSYLLECDLDGNPHHPKLQVKEIIFDQFFTSCPDRLRFIVGAQFIVSKSAILNRSKSFYEKLLKEFDRTDIDNSLTEGGGGAKGNRMPWVMERVWIYLFDKSLKIKD